MRRGKNFFNLECRSYVTTPNLFHSLTLSCRVIITAAPVGEIAESIELLPGEYDRYRSRCGTGWVATPPR
jgi:hypothetical protein